MTDQNENIYGSACPKKAKRFNSRTNFCESAHNITPAERVRAAQNRAEMIKITKRKLNESNN